MWFIFLFDLKVLKVMEVERGRSNRGFQLFWKCLDESPDLISSAKQIDKNAYVHETQVPDDKQRSHPTSVVSSNRSIKVPVKTLSGLAYNINERFVCRPLSAPDPWTYFTLKSPPENKGSKFTSRKEPKLDPVPSPGSYVIHEKVSNRYGYLSQEPKMKVPHGDNKIGPGFYELNEAAPRYVGTVFTKDSRDLVIATGGGIPGPGHYRTPSSDSAKCYSISKSNQLTVQFPQKLGPGFYELESVKRPSGHSFSNTQRFDLPYFDRIETYLVVAKAHNAEQSDNTFLRKNRNITDHRPITKEEKLRRTHCLNEVRRKITQKTKKAILESVRLRRQEAIDAKFKRFESRQRRSQSPRS